MFTLLLSLVLAFDVPPVLPISDALQICILQAELCAAEAAQPLCGVADKDELGACVADYEDCSYDLDGAHEDSCRVAHVWCALEGPVNTDPDFLEGCEAIDKACPSL